MNWRPSHRTPENMEQLEVCDMCGLKVPISRLHISEVEGLRGYAICDVHPFEAQARLNPSYNDQRRESPIYYPPTVGVREEPFGAESWWGSPVLSCSFDMTATSATFLFHFVDMTSVTDYVIQAGDILEYMVRWADSGSYVSFDYTCSDGSALRNSGVTDQNGVVLHPSTDLSSRAFGFGYRRVIQLPEAHVGKTIANYDLVCWEPNKTSGVRVGFLHGIKIVSPVGVVNKAIWDSGDSLPTTSVRITNGDNSLTLTTVDG